MFEHQSIRFPMQENKGYARRTQILRTMTQSMLVQFQTFVIGKGNIGQ